MTRWCFSVRTDWGGEHVAGAGSRRPRGGRLRPAPGCGCDHDRRHQRGAAEPRPKRRLRPDRSHQARSPRRAGSRDRRRTHGRFGDRCGGFRSQGPWRRRSARHRAEPGDGDHPAGRAIGIPGLYVTEDPGAHDEAAKTGNLSLRRALAGPSRTPSTPARRPSCATIASS